MKNCLKEVFCFHYNFNNKKIKIGKSKISVFKNTSNNKNITDLFNLFFQGFKFRTPYIFHYLSPFCVKICFFSILIKKSIVKLISKHLCNKVLNKIIP